MNRLALAMIAVLAFSGGCGDPSTAEQEAEAAAPVVAEKVTRPEKIDLIVAIGKVEPEKEIIYLAAGSSGIVTEVFKQDGDAVRPGDPLVKLDDELERLQVEQVRQQIVTQQSQIELDKVAIRSTETSLAAKRRDLATTDRLVQTGAETGQELNDLKTEIELLEVELEQNKRVVELSANRLSELQRQLQLSQTQADRKILRAPAGGTVLDMLVHPGNALNQYADYAEFAGEGAPLVRAEVDELFANQLQAELPVEIRFIGNAENVATGRITKLSPYLQKKSLFSEIPGEREDRLVREIEITLDGRPSLLLNAKVECVIKL